MYIIFYSYNQGGKNYISTQLPPGLQGLPTFDIFVELPCPHFLLENIFASTNINNSEFLYKIHIPITQDYVNSLTVEDNHYIASLWLMHNTENILYYTLDYQADCMVLKIDPPHPVEYAKLLDLSNMFLNSTKQMQDMNQKLCMQIIFRIPV
jgi:hypothetical protein